eukprot:gnl/TRDRNA2_/TRDRNA2_164020_c1_seq1.p1 gnl/TRDRNA2_/TRDRNA2_164020_c1~~gnl/TRDRNA2_/TRDRNA2_164020_c1_seq1.p1  ORF type:complete len:129 (+),score=29.88 gnl/TRDRNA2_/TRDRNA2_164020_c1_seq1:783-1169(+)
MSEAAHEFQAVLRERKKLLGVEDPRTLQSARLTLDTLRMAQTKPGQSIKVLNTVASGLPPAHPQAAWWRHELGLAFASAGRHAEASSTLGALVKDVEEGRGAAIAAGDMAAIRQNLAAVRQQRQQKAR